MAKAMSKEDAEKEDDALKLLVIAILRLPDAVKVPRMSMKMSSPKKPSKNKDFGADLSAKGLTVSSHCPQSRSLAQFTQRRSR